MRADEVKNMKKLIEEGKIGKPTVPAMQAVQEALHADPLYELDLLRRDNRTLNANLTSVQERCTELLEENRRLRGKVPFRKEAALALIWNPDIRPVPTFLALHEPGRWHLPGGKVEVGESLVDTLDRELREEIGLPLSTTIIQACCVHSAWGDYERDRMVYLFDVRFDPRIDPIAREEGSSLGWFSPYQFLEAVPPGTFYRDAFRRLGLVGPATPAPR